VRTISLFGLSDVKIQFNYEYTYEEALQRVLNRLSQAPPLPNGATPQISPTSPVGEIMRYKLVGPAGYTPTDMKTLQDWVLQRRFKAIPGVVDVTAFGGKAKEYEVAVDLNRLQAQGLTLVQLTTALNNASINVGGQTLNVGQQSAVVRGIGLIRDMDDIKDTMISLVNGTPVLVRDVGRTAADVDRGVARTVTSAAGALLVVDLLGGAVHVRARQRRVRAGLALGELVANHALQDVRADFLDAEHGVIELDVASLGVIQFYDGELHEAAPSLASRPAGFGASLWGATFTASRTSTQELSAPGTAPFTRMRPRAASTRTISRFCVVTRSTP
jgi:Cu/Ag efflux pump CusA